MDKAFGKEMRGAGNVNKPKNIYVLFWGIVQFGTDPMSQIKKLVKLVKNLYGEFNPQSAMTHPGFMLHSLQAAQKVV